MTKDPNGHYSQALSDIFGHEIATWARANSADYNKKNPDPDTLIVSTTSYDILGNKILVTPPTTPNPRGIPGQADAINTTYNYNVLGQLVSTTTPDAGTVTYTYYDNGKLHEVADQVSQDYYSPRYGYILTYAYDALGRNTCIADSSPSAGIVVPQCRTIYDDPQNTAPFITAADLNTTSATLAAVLSNLANTRGRVVANIAYNNSFAANSNKPLTKAIYLFSYDAEGRDSIEYSMIPGLPSYQVTCSFYDVQGKLNEEVDSIPSSATLKTAVITNYTYDANGRLATITRDGTPVVTYSYDPLGKITSKQFAAHAGSPANGVNYKYTIRDWDSLIYDNNLQYSENITAAPGAGYDNAGNLLNATYYYVRPSPLTAVTDNEQYVYDGVDRLKSGTGSQADGNNAFIYTYQYLNDGRILQKLEGVSGSSERSWGDYNYTAGTNQLAYIPGSKRNDNKTYADGTTTKDQDQNASNANNDVYDDNGNMIFDRSKHMAVTYDWRNMPVQFTFFDFAAGTDPYVGALSDVRALSSTAGVTVHTDVFMTYDAAGNRVKKEVVDYIALAAQPTPLNSAGGLAFTSENSTPIVFQTNGNMIGPVQSSQPLNGSSAQIPSGSLVFAYNNGSGPTVDAVFTPTGAHLPAPCRPVPPRQPPAISPCSIPPPARARSRSRR